MSAILVLRRLRQEECGVLEFKTSLGFTLSLCLKKEQKTKHTPAYNEYIPWPDRRLLFNFGGLSTGVLLKVQAIEDVVVNPNGGKSRFRDLQI